MKLTHQSALAALTLVIGGFLGASALVTFAGSWTSAPANPPSSNTDAPINVSSVFQNKVGKFSLGTLIDYTNETNRPLLDVNGTGIFTNVGVAGDLLVSAGASTTYGAVLTTTGDGKAKWAAISTTGTGGTCNQSPTTINAGTVYQNMTGSKIIVVASESGAQNNGTSFPFLSGYTGSASANTVVVTDDANSQGAITFIVPPGYYYKVINGGGYAGTISAKSWQLCEGTSSGSFTQAGTVAGGCNANETGAVGGTVTESKWGNASIAANGSTCTCPTGYTFQKTASDVIWLQEHYMSGICVKN